MADATSKLGKGVALGCGGLFAAVWIVGWSAITIAFDVLCVRSIVQQSLASAYPSVPGQVVESKVESRSDSDGTSYSARVRYAYTVNDHRFESDRIRYGMSTGGRRQSSAFVRKHPPGAAVTVYYDPTNPSQALLEPGVSGADLFMILFLTPFNVIMLGSWVFAAGYLRKLRNPGGHFKRRVGYGPAGTFVKLPGLSPLWAGVAAAGGIAFVLIFIVGFATGMRPSVGVTVAALLVVAGGGVWVGRRARNTHRRGAHELHIDPARRTVTLPLKIKRQKQRTTISFEQIDAVEVKKTVKKGSESSTIRYVPAIRWTHSSGTPHTTALAPFDDEDEANAMRDWLVHELGLSARGQSAASV